ncbi:MAG: adenine phosphoribosyltransferase [Candidatus Pelagibacterales bacterium]|jgi:adenine phosphoribosyltransferase|tara:strand:- start:3547 stop:4086 length:540 start_codon:yes stop_codon:yes gene_type:complete
MIKKLSEQLKKEIRVIPNFPKKGILFQDITSITDNKKLFKQVIVALSQYVKQNTITKIAGIEARGFIFGAALANESCLPFVPIRKASKLPGEIYKQKYKLEYGEDEIQIHKNAVNKSDKVLIIDDLIATGGTAQAAAKLISKCKPKDIEFYFIINLNNLDGFKKLQKNYKAKFILQAEG